MDHIYLLAQLKQVIQWGSSSWWVWESTY
uniref:Uncharacterized protein n=1 Tax=Rhizophora mucronata TaxID=61149 RepID=A0A2P2NT76_RHIMU